jgi:DNA-directed RNA polymerase subunit RPC12/RpoP
MTLKRIPLTRGAYSKPEKFLDITDKVEFLNPDDESLPLTKCACGVVFTPWDFDISVYEDDLTACPNCGRKMFFESNIRVFELIEGGEKR